MSRRQREVSLPFEPSATAGTDRDPAAASEHLDLAALLRTLPDAQQQVVTLRYIQDLSLREVAQIMGRSDGAVKQLAFRALRTLRERMDDN
jgi:RNA polymerase sigma-70 factor (ECF subfamily)